MPKDLQVLINKAMKAAGPKKPANKEANTSMFKETSQGPDELVQTHAEDERLKKLLEDRDQRVKEGMDFLLSAADSVLSASRSRENQS